MPLRFAEAAFFGGFILRDAACRPLLRMRSETLMVRSAAKLRFSSHEATDTRY
jgi:hypothetical protein